jgi:hypothetical protein
MKRVVLAVLVGALAGPAWAERPSLSRNTNPPDRSQGQVPLKPLAVETISQSTDVTTVTAGNSVSCNNGAAGGFLHTDNSYYRGMTLSTFPVLTLPQFVVQQVTIAVEQANGSSGSQPITARVWSATANPIGGAPDPPGNNQVSSEAVSVTNQTLTLLPINLTTQPNFLVASGIVAVEIFTPDGQATGNSFFIGSNAGGQSAPSYIKAAPCAVNNITNLASIGFANMHLVMQVTGNNQVPVELMDFQIGQ